MASNLEQILGAVTDRRNRLASTELLGRLESQDASRPASALMADPDYVELQRISPERAEQFGNRRLAIKQSLKVEDDESAEAFFKDMAQVKLRLQGGDLAGAKTVLLNRKKALNQIPGADSADVDRIINRLDNEDFSGAMEDLVLAEQIGVSEGYLGAPSRENEFKDREIAVKEGELILDMRELEAKLSETPDRQGQINVLRSTLDSQLADFRSIEAASDRIDAVGSAATPAGDLALIFNFMKLLDPASVVRESEFRSAADAKAWLVEAEEDGFKIPAPIANAIRKASTGNILEDLQRDDFLSQASALRDAAWKSGDTIIDQVLERADQDDIPQEKVLGRRRLEAYNKRRNESSSGASGMPVVSTQDQYDSLPSGAEFMEDGKRYRKP